MVMSVEAIHELPLQKAKWLPQNDTFTKKIKMKKTILFICVENSCRSQMAEGFAKNLAGDKFEIHSAGSRPSGKVNPSAIEVMKEDGIDISGQRSKGFTDVPVKKFDYVISLGCGDVCPYYPTYERIDWQIKNPKGKDIEVFKRVREEIRSKVKGLLEAI